MRFGRNLAAIVSRWRQSQSGNIAIISGLALPALVGFCGLGVDAGYWYFRQRDLQGAVDIAAYNATLALRSGATTSAITYGASGDAAFNGWNPGQGTIVVHTPPTSGTHQTTNAIEVILTETEPRFFSAIFTQTPVNASVRAVGSYASSGVACLLALNKTAHKALQFWGNNTTTMNGCNVMSDSFASDRIGIGGSSTLTAPCAISAGGVSVTSTLNLTSCVHPLTNSPPAADPYASLAAPPIPGSCQSVPNNGTLAPGKYCGGL